MTAGLLGRTGSENPSPSAGESTWAGHRNNWATPCLCSLKVSAWFSYRICVSQESLSTSSRQGIVDLEKKASPAEKGTLWWVVYKADRVISKCKLLILPPFIHNALCFGQLWSTSWSALLSCPVCTVPRFTWKQDPHFQVDWSPLVWAAEFKWAINSRKYIRVHLTRTALV